MVQKNPKLVPALIEALAANAYGDVVYAEPQRDAPDQAKMRRSAGRAHLMALRQLGVAALPDLLRATGDKDARVVAASLVVILMQSDDYADFPHERVVAALLKALESQPAELRPSLQIAISCVILRQTNGPAYEAGQAATTILAQALDASQENAEKKAKTPVAAAAPDNQRTR